MDSQRRKPLRGLLGVTIIIEYLDPEIEREGVTKERLRSLAEERVRAAGIKVSTPDDCAQYISQARKERGQFGQLDRTILAEGPCAHPDLYINVNAHRIDVDFVFSVRVQLLEDVTPARDPTMTVQAATWQQNAVGVGTVAQLLRGLDDLLRRFIDDHLAANPK
jgi:hypothetical protein